MCDGCGTRVYLSAITHGMPLKGTKGSANMLQLCAIDYQRLLPVSIPAQDTSVCEAYDG